MKKTLPILIVLLFVLCACEKEQQDISEEESLNLNTPVNDDMAHGRGNDCCHEENFFERQLHWFSATTSRVLRYHPAARNELATEVSNSLLNTVSAEMLLDDNSSLVKFETAFKAEFIYYLSPLDPSTDNTAPNPPPVPGSFPGGTDVNVIYEAYKDVLLNENCVELYFPTGLDITTPFNSTATAHPLTTANINEGILRVYSLAPGGAGGSTSTSLSTPVEVDDSYVNRNANVIVARPIRISSSEISGATDCTYTQYSGIVFTDFLD